jgi:SAM-dependent methyltransferase
LNLVAHPDRPKNWDSLAALELILKRTRPDEAVLDAGGEEYSTLLDWLVSYGYERLFSMNIVFPRTSRRGRIQYLPGDITKTNFPDGTFGAVACLSVIEHGVNLTDYFREMARILRDGGVLVTSTDYWGSGMETQGRIAYGVPVKILSRDEIRQMIEIAERNGLVPISSVDLECVERVVHWKGMNLRFTFIVLGFEKRAVSRQSVETN